MALTWVYVTTAHADGPAGQRISPFAAGIVLPISVITAILHCIAGVLDQHYWFDEVYMLSIGRSHLDWGSADQPPLTPALAALADAVAPGSLIVLRLAAVLATAGAVVVAGLIARELGCDRRAQGLTAAAQATMAWSSLVGHWLTPYSLEPVEWLLLIWLLVRWVRVREDRLLLAAGVVAGIAAMTKFQIVLLGVVLFVAIAAVGPRALLRRPLLWAGMAIAVALAMPTLIWQYLNGWPQLKMAPVVAGEAEALYGGRPGIAVQLIVFAGVLGVGLGAYGLWLLFRVPALRDYRFLGISFVVLYVVFVATAGRPYYIVGLYAPLAAVGALGLQWRREAGSRGSRWLAWPAYTASVALAGMMLIFSTTAVLSDVPEKIARSAGEVYRSLPADRQERTALIGDSYIVAAYLDGYGDRYDLPVAYSLNRSYGYFPPPPDDQSEALYIGREPGELRQYFADVRVAGDIGEDMRAYLLTGRQQPWELIWSRLRNLTVS
ncbi:glycosyl transferase family 39 [Mycobacterium vulneris]|nr:glycosyl transferase family 39 [Mycolicibacterium vulneris]OCB66079.1 glycosyl transferase family 39 [Mycolicibacterium vulneris]